MLISRISGCKFTAFFLNDKVLNLVFYAFCSCEWLKYRFYNIFNFFLDSLSWAKELNDVNLN